MAAVLRRVYELTEEDDWVNYFCQMMVGIVLLGDRCGARPTPHAKGETGTATGDGEQQ